MSAVFRAFRGPQAAGVLGCRVGGRRCCPVLDSRGPACFGSGAHPKASVVHRLLQQELDGWTVHDEGTVSTPSRWQVVNYN